MTFRAMKLLEFYFYKTKKILVKLPPRETVHTIVFDFDGIFTNNKVWVDQNGNESVCCDRSDGLAINFLKKYQKKINKNQRKFILDFFILSKEKNLVVSARAKKLNIKCVYGIDNKLEYLKKYFTRRFPRCENPFSGLIYLGNDLNDLEPMRFAGFSIAPADAHLRIHQIASDIYCQNGGEGFVRAFIDKFLKT